MTALPPRCHRADPRQDGAVDSPWWLAYCRVNQEIGISDRLTAADVPHLLPVAQYDRAAPSGKRRSTVRPLFPGYIFLTGSGLYSATPRALRGIVSSNPIADVQGLVTDLARLCELIEMGAPLGCQSRPLEPGEPVRITSGMFEGFEGVYLRGEGKDVIWIRVRMANGMLPMSVEGWRVERIGERD